LRGESADTLCFKKLFIDNEKDERTTFNTLMNYVNKMNDGPSIMIGHPYPSTIKALREAAPLLEAKGVSIVPLQRRSQEWGENQVKIGMNKAS